jgi:hypothetical protein
MSFPILLTFPEGFSDGGLQKLEYLLFQESLTEALTDICRKA